MGGQVLPEWQAEDLGIAGGAGPDVGRQGAPDAGEPATDALQAEERRRLEQLPAGLVQREPAGRSLLEHALAGQMPEDILESAGVAAGRRGELLDAGDPGGEVVGDPQGRHHADAPGGAQVAQRLEVSARLRGCW
jgi:hypothetical protein